MNCKDCKNICEFLKNENISIIETQLDKCEKCVYFKDDKSKQQIKTYRDMRFLYVLKYWENIGKISF